MGERESSEQKNPSLFQKRLEFHPERKPFSGFSNYNPKFHLETLNPTSHRPSASPLSSSSGKKKPDFSEHGLDPELCFQITVRRIGAGLENLGNTCFLNSVLQCLTYTEPFAAYLQSGNHKSSCHTSGFCAMCAIQNHVRRALQSTGRILAPKDLVTNLRCISRNFRNARQEDAHEYMVNLLESMHKCCLPSGVPSESPSAYDKSLVHKIFGGRLRSQVKCLQCSHCSNTFDPFLDLSLEIVKADSLRKALTHFTAVEQLDGGERQYQCQRCRQKVKALKQLTVHKAPYVLSIHLKRFSSHVPGQKIDKKVEFSPTLDLKPFVSGFNEGDLNYTLYGVLVHAGWSTHSGHYYCFVRTSSGLWHSLDDNRVIQVSERTVLQQKAYMLFYVRDRKIVVPKSKPIGKREGGVACVKLEAAKNGQMAKGLPTSESLKQVQLKMTNPPLSKEPILKFDIKEELRTSVEQVGPPSSDIHKGMSKVMESDQAPKSKLSSQPGLENMQIEKVVKAKKKVMKLRNANMRLGFQLLKRASGKRKRQKQQHQEPSTSTKRQKKTSDPTESVPKFTSEEKQLDGNTLLPQVKKCLLEFTVDHCDKDRQKSFNIGYVPDEWDEEYDRGKRKKLRNPKDHRFGESKNPFQEIATKLRKEKIKRRSF